MKTTTGERVSESMWIWGACVHHKAATLTNQPFSHCLTQSLGSLCSLGPKHHPSIFLSLSLSALQNSFFKYFKHAKTNIIILFNIVVLKKYVHLLRSEKINDNGMREFGQCLKSDPSLI